MKIYSIQENKIKILRSISEGEIFEIVKPLIMDDEKSFKIKEIYPVSKSENANAHFVIVLESLTRLYFSIEIDQLKYCGLCFPPDITRLEEISTKKIESK